MQLAELPRTAIYSAIKRATLAAHKAVIKLDASTLDELQGLYKQAANQIGAAIANHAGADGNLALQELQSSLAQVNGILKQLSEQRDVLLQTGLGKAADLGAQPYIAAAAITPAAGMRVANDALNFTRTFVAADGLQLSDRIWRIDRGARDLVVNHIEQAVIQGQGAAQAAREFLQRGVPVPVEVQGKIAAANGAQIGKGVTTQLLTGTGAPMDNAMRLFRTEINRAHGEAFMKGGEGTQGFAGWRYLLSPAHPKPDICDLLSTQNLHGLGDGVYPSREKTPWPAHPNTLSFIEMVFDDEITDQAKAGKETPLQAMKRLNPEQQKGVLGAGKFALYKEDKITQGMIRTPLSKVKQRIGASTPIIKPVKLPPPDKTPTKPTKKTSRKLPTPKTLDQFIAAGDAQMKILLDKAADIDKLTETLLADLGKARPLATPAKLASRGRGAALVEQASLRFPDDWTRAGDRFGTLEARFKQGRAWYKGGPSGDGIISTRDLTSSVHEYTHRLQQAIPALDDFFQELHLRRTKGDPIKPLRRLIPGSGYSAHEVVQEDKYVHPYQGRIYNNPRMVYLGKQGALEVMTMAFEAVLGDYPVKLKEMVQRDPEMVKLTIGLLYRYAP